MTVSPVEIDVRMGGSAIQLISRVSPITILLVKAGYLPLTWTLICDPTKPHRSILRISCEYWPNAINDLNTLSFLANTVQSARYGDGSSTGALTHTTHISISALQRKAKQMAASSKHLSLAAKPALYALAAFLAAWQATEFSFDARAVLGALTACVLGYASPKKK